MVCHTAVRSCKGGGGWLVAGALICAVISGCQWTAGTHNREGVRLYQQGYTQGAVSHFQQALQIDPRDADAYYNLAAAYHQSGLQARQKGTMAQAEDLYHRCLDLQPDHPECYRGLAALLVQTDRTSSAFRLLEGWSQRSPQSADARIELARLHEEFGRTNQAEQYLTSALDLNSRSPRAWAALGRLRERHGEYAQALSNYRQAYYLRGYSGPLGDRIARLQRDVLVGDRTNLQTGTQIAAPPSTVLPR